MQKPARVHAQQERRNVVPSSPPLVPTPQTPVQAPTPRSPVIAAPSPTRSSPRSLNFLRQSSTPAKEREQKPNISIYTPRSASANSIRKPSIYAPGPVPPSPTAPQPQSATSSQDYPGGSTPGAKAAIDYLRNKFRTRSYSSPGVEITVEPPVRMFSLPPLHRTDCCVSYVVKTTYGDLWPDATSTISPPPHASRRICSPAPASWKHPLRSEPLLPTKCTRNSCRAHIDNISDTPITSKWVHPGPHRRSCRCRHAHGGRQR